MRPKPKIFDGFCCQGGAAYGLTQAGFEVVGVDVEPQPKYPFTFIQADAIEYFSKHSNEFVAAWFSPPCQFASQVAAPQRAKGKVYPNFIPQTREVAKQSGLPYIIENVATKFEGKQLLINPGMLCGLTFDLPLYRHRFFETNFYAPWPYHPPHPTTYRSTGNKNWQFDKKYPEHFTKVYTITGNDFNRAEGVKALGGCEWMNNHGMSQAIPPKYSEFIGFNLRVALGLNKKYYYAGKQLQLL